MQSLKFQCRILAAMVLFAISACAIAGQTFDEAGLVGDSLQVRIEAKYISNELVGIDVYELWPEENVGHAFLSKRSYYRVNDKIVVEDRDWYYVNGLGGDKTLEVENRYETQNWSTTPKINSAFDRAAQLAANQNTSIEDLKQLYRSLQSLFTVKFGELEREGKSQWRWLSGLQRIGDIEVFVDKSQKYGNHFNAKFAK